MSTVFGLYFDNKKLKVYDSKEKSKMLESVK